ncbi:hypothetical protein PYW07_006511 [Mythimna separata]|uniref:Uncharacterized protein n=1 Tax=Mythimna separata TaxID=271217 RepID=A0AAD7YUV6_MYTSE|nr:hypothetical protein PYW07_006511 [Mythimna separata]
MKPSKLMRHLTTKHQKEADKPLDFFERKLKALSQQQNTIIQASSVNESSLLASYKVAYRVAKAGKPHTIAENLILPAALDMVEIMKSDKTDDPSQPTTSAIIINQDEEEIPAEIFEADF